MKLKLAPIKKRRGKKVVSFKELLRETEEILPRQVVLKERDFDLHGNPGIHAFRHF